MPHKVVITQSTAGRSGPPQTMLDVLNEAGLDVEVAACANENDLINAGKDADVMLVGTVPHTTRKVLESLPKLKMVGRSGVGVDSIDLDAATNDIRDRVSRVSDNLPEDADAPEILKQSAGFSTSMWLSVSSTTWSDLELGDFVHTFGDAHIYSNHLEQVELQLSRDFRELPTMKINPDVKDIFSFKYEDFELINYDPHPHIKGVVAV